MDKPRYIKNSEIVHFFTWLESTKGLLDKIFEIFTKHHKHEISDSDLSIFLNDILSQLQSIISAGSSFTENIRFLKQFPISNKSNSIFKKKIENLYVDFSKAITELKRLLESNLNSDSLQNCIDIFSNFSHRVDEIYSILLNMLIRGEVDFNVLPTKNRMETALKKGTVLLIDISNSMALTEESRNEIINTVRRISYRSEAWEWTDMGDGLLLVFVDNEGQPKDSHASRAIDTAIELMAVITHKPYLFSEGIHYSQNIQNQQDAYRKPELVVALNSLEDNKTYETLTELTAFASDPDTKKLSNRILLIGNNTFEKLQDHFRLYQGFFHNIIPNHPTFKKPIYVSSKIGFSKMTVPKGKKVFLSYASEDLNFVQRIYNELAKRGLDLWFDKADLKPGSWYEQVMKAIPRSSYFVICISESALTKLGDDPGFQDNELNRAFEIAMRQLSKDFSIIPVRIERCDRGDSRLTIFQQYDLFENFENNINRLAVDMGGISLA